MAVAVPPIRAKFFGYKPVPEIPTSYPSTYHMPYVLRTKANERYELLQYRNVRGGQSKVTKTSERGILQLCRALEAVIQYTHFAFASCTTETRFMALLTYPQGATTRNRNSSSYSQDAFPHQTIMSTKGILQKVLQSNIHVNLRPFVNRTFCSTHRKSRK